MIGLPGAAAQPLPATRLLRLAAGLDAPTSGTVQAPALDTTGTSDTAFVFQEPTLMPWATVADNVWLPLRLQGRSRAQALPAVQAVLARVGLADFADSHPQQLSGGMKMRASIARALVTQPRVLLMDEPFAALDIGLKAQLHRLLLRHQAGKGTAVLMITHDLMEAVRLADTVLVMAAGPGRIVHQHSPQALALARTDAMVYHDTAELLRVPAVRAAFGLDVLQDEGACATAPGSAVNVLPLQGHRLQALQPAPAQGEKKGMRCG